MYKIKYFIAAIILTKSVINCVPNCSSTTKVFIQSDNISVFSDKIIKSSDKIEPSVNELSHNGSSYMRFNVIPEISDYERGKVNLIYECRPPLKYLTRC